MKQIKKLFIMMLIVSVFSVNINAYSGEIVPFATSRPTQECPYSVYDHDFSGTRNYTYSDYYWGCSNIVITADSKFVVKTYRTNGSYLQTISPERQSNGSYILQLDNYSGQNYYFVIYNRTSSPMKNATYSAYKEGYCNLYSARSFVKKSYVHEVKF